MVKRIVSALGLLLVVAGCASTPTWEGMSESQIAAWRDIGVEAEWAQKFTKAGLSSSDVAAWRAAGISEGEAILDWAQEGFSAQEGGEWVKDGFDLETAADWREENFSASEAKAWRDADFSLRSAVSERKKGLSPVQ